MSEGNTPRKSGEADPSVALDAALAAWPTLPGQELEPDDAVRRVLSLIVSEQPTRLARASPPVSDDELLRPPFPALPGERQGSAMDEPRREGTGMTAASREQNRASLRDLARLASAASLSSRPVSSVPSSRRPSSSEANTEREESSGVIHLGALGAAGDLSHGPDAGPHRPPSAARSPGPSLPPRHPSPGKRSRSWVGIASAVAAVAVAAGVFFGVRHTAHDEGVGMVVMAPLALSPVSAAPTVAAAVPTEIAVASGRPDDTGNEPGRLLPASMGGGARSTPVSVPASSPKPFMAAPSARTTTAPVVLAAVPTATASPSDRANLQALMQQAAGVTSAPVAPAAASLEAPPETAGSVPLRPSQGALQGALGAALPAARACLGPDDAISHATVTFASDGSVVEVGISGGAAGKPAEGCIRSALMKARVAPFARPTFTGTATVRPN
jgi:hypothetical protein